MKEKDVRVSWIKSNNIFSQVEGEIENVEKIPVGVYNITLDITGWHLEKTQDKFIFDYKIYGLQSKFINHVKKAYHNTTGNFGILMNGTRGTGKTVTAKVLANDFNLPIILVKSFVDNNSAMIEFISKFNFDCVLFFDEFEKNFDSDDVSILSIMDGIYTSEYRKIFLLTTNHTHINENLISRPSRLRYIHEFGNLEKEVVEEYLKDNLKDQSVANQVMDYIDTLEISTIDILKSIIDEINIFGIKEFFETKEYFNVKTQTYTYNGYTFNIPISTREKFDFTLKDFTKEVETVMELGGLYSEENIARNKELRKNNKIAFENEKSNLKTKIVVDFNYQTFNNVRIKFSNWHQGDVIKYGNTYSDLFMEIIKIDHKSNTFVAKIKDDDGYLLYGYITNPKAVPSLYNSAAYGYASQYGE